MRTSLSHRREIRSRRAWTLMEVILVFGIIVIAAAIGGIATKGVRTRSHDARCVYNLRQLGAAFLNYTTDANNRVIRSQMGGGSIEMGWTRLIVNLGYLPANKPWEVMHCPVAAIPEGAERSKASYSPSRPNVAAGDTWRWYTYGLNMCKITGKTSITTATEKSGASVRMFELPIALIDQPSRHVLLADSSAGPTDHWPSLIMERDHPKGLGLRHGPRGNRHAYAFFLDGHVGPIDKAFAAQLATSAYGYGLNLPATSIFNVTP